MDPGSVRTGYGIIDSDGHNNRHITHGVINIGHLGIPDRLARIYSQLTDIINQWAPQEMAIEQVFMSRNADSALKLGQARGVAIAACVGSALPVSEYAAKAVKQAVVGTGAASKQQVQHMTQTLLNLQGGLQADAADALAIAICHGHFHTSRYLTAADNAKQGVSALLLSRARRRKPARRSMRFSETLQKHYGAIK